MALQFNPPTDLVNAYLNRPSPGQIATEGINQAFQTYVQQKSANEKEALAKQQLASQDAQRKAAEFKAIADYVPEDQIPGLAKNYGINIPSAGSMPPIQSTGTAVTPNEMAAQQSLPSEHPGGAPSISPIVQAHIDATGHNPLGLPTSKAGLAKYKTGLETQKLQKDLAPAPDLQTVTKEQAIKDGTFNKDKQLIVEPPVPKDTSAQDQRREERMSKAVTDYGKQIETNPIIKNLETQQIGIHQVEEMGHLVAQGNTVASSAMGTKMARAMGEVGVLTETDVKRYIQSGKLTQSAGDKLSQWINGTPSHATLTEINQITGVLGDSFDGKIQPIYNRYVDRFARAYKLDPNEAANLLAIPYKTGHSNGGATNTLPELGGTFEGGRVISIKKVSK